jgi:DNA-binding FrmR family transcriptional regulator
MVGQPDSPDSSPAFPAEQQQPGSDRLAALTSLQDVCTQTFDRLGRLEAALQRTEGLVTDKPWDVFTLAHKRLERVEETVRCIQRSIDDSTLPEMCVNIERQIVQTRMALQRTGETVTDESIRQLCESIDARLLRTEETVQRIEQLVSMRTAGQMPPRAEPQEVSLPWMSGLAVTALVLVTVAIGVLFSMSRGRIREQAETPAATQTVAAPAPTRIAAPAVTPAVAAQPTQAVAASSVPTLTANTSPSIREEADAARDRQPPPRPSAQVATRQMFVGTLSITSVPSGASVSINGKAAGVTPLRLPRQRAGSLAVQIAQEGFERWSAAVRVPADQLTQVTAKLRPMAQ